MKRATELRDLSDDPHTGLALARRCRRAGRADSELSPEQVWEQVLEAFSSRTSRSRSNICFRHWSPSGRLRSLTEFEKTTTLFARYDSPNV